MRTTIRISRVSLAYEEYVITHKATSRFDGVLLKIEIDRFGYD